MDPSAEEWRRKVEVVAFVYLKTAILESSQSA